MDCSELSIIVPVFNEQATICELLLAVRDVFPHSELIVVDDGSTDCSISHVLELKERLQLVVGFNGSNLGKGAAIQHGLTLASREWVAIQDADLEYDPMDLKLITESFRGGAVYGSRYLKSGRRKHGAVLNYWSVRILAIWQLMLYGKWMSDPHTCYKIIRLQILRLLNISSNGFEICAEINCKLHLLGVDIVEVPISYRPRGFRAGKKIKLRDFFRAFSTYLRCRFWTCPDAWLQNIGRHNETKSE